MGKSKKIIYLEKVLCFMASVVLRKYKPKIVGITGSVGKTSTKEAVFLVLSYKFRVRQNEGNYNNEIGLPLTIIGSKSGESSILGWIRVALKWIFVVVLPIKYPEILVLEMGVDRPGDMKYLMSFIPANVGVVTNISSSHLEFFKDVNNIAKEKGDLIRSLNENGRAILNADDEIILGMQEDTKAEVCTFGFSGKAQVKATDIHFNYQDNKISGLSFKLNYAGRTMPIRLPHILAHHQAFSVLAAMAVGDYFKINLVEAASVFVNFSPPCGRMNLLPGMKDSLVIDDTYNSSPTSSLAALDVVEKINAPRKIVIFGDMLELGEESKAGHLKVVQKVFNIKADLFLTVGDRMKEAVQEFLKTVPNPEDFEKKIKCLNDPSFAGSKARLEIEKGDLILIKGSQSMRMEKTVEEIVEKLSICKDLLCRQSKDWQRKPFVKP